MAGNNPCEISFFTEREEKLESAAYTEVLEVLQRDNTFVSEFVYRL